MRLSVVIPVYNEHETLFEILRQVIASPIDIEREIILVDDYSTDGTRDLYPKLNDEFPGQDFNVVLQKKNQGKGSAVRTGFENVKGDIVIIQDADLEYDPQDYPRLLKPILDGKADVVYGSRYLRTGEDRVHAFWHTLMNRGLTTFSNMFTNLNLTDMETCYKCMKAEVVKSMKLESDRFGIEPEMTAKIARGHWRVFEVPISYDGRSYEEGKKIGAKDGFQAIWTILKHWACRS